MRLPRGEGFLYTKHPIRNAVLPLVTGRPAGDGGKTFGYAYTARHLPRPPLTAAPKDWEWLTLVFGYAYSARYARTYDQQLYDDQIERIAA